MQLSYRGIKFQARPATIATVPSNVIGRYRGLQVRTQVTPAA